MFFFKFNNFSNNLSHGIFLLVFLKLSVNLTETEIKMKKKRKFFFMKLDV